MQEATMINVTNLTKTFNNHKALDNLNLNVKQGSIYGLVGVNGAGKTTIIKHIAGIYRQDSGTVTINNQPIYDNASLKAKIGYVPDELYFFPGYNLRMLKSFYHDMYKTWDYNRYTSLIQQLNLNETRRLGHFSKGMQKQAAIAMALSITPEVLLLDEPIDGLDPMVRKQIFKQIINGVAEWGMTVLISSHNLREMDDICDTIGLVKNGQMAIEKDLDDLKADLTNTQGHDHLPLTLEEIFINQYTETEGHND